MLNFEGSCTTDTGLCLGSASLLNKPHNEKNHLQSHRLPDHQQNYKRKLLTLKSDHSFPSLALGLSSPSSEKYVKFDASTGKLGSESTVPYRLQSLSSVSAVTSYSCVKKKERDLCGEEDLDQIEKVSPKLSDDRDEAGTSTARKKLKLTREQSMVLEDSFKEHTALNPKRKQDLANQLNLQTRQVEVWFQNRRARTKLKQTEIECELLKKCCQKLTDENQKLEKELQELKELYKESAPLFHMQTPTAATLTMCPSCCERTGGDGGCVGGGGGGENSSTRPFSNIGLKPQFHNPFTHPSAACETINYI